MVFPRFSQFFKWKSSASKKEMKSLIRNQFLVYFWSSRIRKSFRIYNFYVRRFQEQKWSGIFKNFRASPVSLKRNSKNVQQIILNYIISRLLRLSNFSSFVINFFLWYQPWDSSQLKIGTKIAYASMMNCKNISMNSIRLTA